MNDAVVWQWAVFAAVVAVLLALDLLVFHRHDRAPSLAGVGRLDPLLVGAGRGLQRPGLVVASRRPPRRGAWPS